MKFTVAVGDRIMPAAIINCPKCHQTLGRYNEYFSQGMTCQEALIHIHACRDIRLTFRQFLEYYNSGSKPFQVGNE